MTVQTVLALNISIYYQQKVIPVEIFWFVLLYMFFFVYLGWGRLTGKNSAWVESELVKCVLPHIINFSFCNFCEELAGQRRTMKYFDKGKQANKQKNPKPANILVYSVYNDHTDNKCHPHSIQYPASTHLKQIGMKT